MQLIFSAFIIALADSMPGGLMGESEAARLLGLWVRIPSGTWLSVSFEFCVSSGIDICVWLITRPEEYYREWCV
jgi:hypothetical protein